MSDDDATRAALDEAIRAHAANVIDPDGEVITSWVVLCGTRRYDGGGVVLSLVNDAAMPGYEARGLMATGLRMVDLAEDDDQPGSGL